MGDAANSFQASNKATPYDPTAGLFGLRLNVPAALDLLGIGRRSTAGDSQSAAAKLQVCNCSALHSMHLLLCCDHLVCWCP
jgi:hypothetical protein